MADDALPKRRRTDSCNAGDGSFLPPAIDVDTTKEYELMRDTASSAGAVWSSKIRRCATASLGTPGIIAAGSIGDGEVLCKMPSSLLVSRAECEKQMRVVFVALAKLEFPSEDRRAEAAHVTCIAVQLQVAAHNFGHSVDVNDTMKKLAADVPAAWKHCANGLLDLNFQDHPYILALRKSIDDNNSPSPEVAHAIEAANYVLAVHKKITALQDMIKVCVDVRYFMHSWLCLLTRQFGTPDGSAMVPLVEFFNHSSHAGADQDWDEEGDAVVIRSCRAHKPGEEVFLTYGDMSNSMLWRTYGFTVPPSSELSCTYTCTDSELQRLCGGDGPAPADLSERIAELPQVHLDSVTLSRPLAQLLVACTSRGADAAVFLKRLCEDTMKRYEDSQALKRHLSALDAARRESANDGAWWTQVDSTDTASRVKMSEYLCLLAHKETLDVASGVKEETACLTCGRELRETLGDALRVLKDRNARACVGTRAGE